MCNRTLRSVQINCNFNCDFVTNACFQVRKKSSALPSFSQLKKKHARASMLFKQQKLIFYLCNFSTSSYKICYYLSLGTVALGGSTNEIRNYTINVRKLIRISVYKKESNPCNKRERSEMSFCGTCFKKYSLWWKLFIISKYYR